MTPFPRGKSDGELPLPKTFLTRRGALMLYSAPDDSLFGECLNHEGCLDYLESNERATFYQLFEAYPDLMLYDNGQYMTALYGINNFSGRLFMRYEFHGADMNRIRNHVNRKKRHMYMNIHGGKFMPSPLWCLSRVISSTRRSISYYPRRFETELLPCN